MELCLYEAYGKSLSPSTQSLSEDTEKLVKNIEENIPGWGLRSGGYEHDDLTYRIIGAAIAVHTALGPGLFEGVYENALCVEFNKRDIGYQRQRRFRIQYDGEHVGELIADLVVENIVIVELKSVQELLPLHEAQTIAYLRAAQLNTGLLINFNVRSLKSGVRRLSV